MRYINFGYTTLSENRYDQERYYYDKNKKVILCEREEDIIRDDNRRGAQLLYVAAIATIAVGIAFYLLRKDGVSPEVNIISLLVMHLLGASIGFFWMKSDEKKRAENIAIEISAKELKEKIDVRLVKKQSGVARKFVYCIVLTDVAIISTSFDYESPAMPVAPILCFLLGFLISIFWNLGHPFSAVKKYKKITEEV